MHNKIIISCTRARYRCFVEYINSIAFLNKYLTDRKIEFVFTENIQYNNTMHFLFLWEIPKKYANYKNITLFNTEQLSRNDIMKHEYIKNAISSNIPIIDYSMQNSNIFKNFNKLSGYLPYQYNDNEIVTLQSLINNTKKEYDVAIIGTPSPYRTKIINELTKNNIKVNYMKETFQNKRDLEISKAKILLNIHFNGEFKIYEHLRCDRWIFAGMLVISENTIDNDCLDVRDLVIFDKYENLVGTVKNVLNEYDAHYNKFAKMSLRLIPNIIESRKTIATELINNL